MSNMKKLAPNIIHDTDTCLDYLCSIEHLNNNSNIGKLTYEQAAASLTPQNTIRTRIL